MLTTQIQYWTLVESKRHNLASEDLGNRTLNENIRHNYVTETETQRHNIATEDYYTNSLNETIRHNLVTEGQGAFKADSERMNAETNRMNAFTNQRNAATNEMNAATNRFSAVTGYALGLDANRIAQQNADSSARTANANMKNAENREKELDIEFLQWATSDKNASTNAMNAVTNVTNAETKQGELKLGYDNLNFNQQRFQWQKFIDVTEEARKNTDSFVNNAVNVMNSIKSK